MVAPGSSCSRSWSTDRSDEDVVVSFFLPLAARRFALPRDERDVSETERERILILLSTEGMVGCWLGGTRASAWIRTFLLYEHFFYRRHRVCDEQSSFWSDNHTLFKIACRHVVWKRPSVPNVPIVVVADARRKSHVFDELARLAV